MTVVRSRQRVVPAALLGVQRLALRPEEQIVEKALFGLAGWQAAFFVVGLPGLLMALWVWTLREPIRGMSEGILQRGSHPHPFRAAFRETAAVLPPFTLWSLWQSGVGSRGLAANLGIAAACALGAWGLITALGSPPQWIALAIGLYSFFSWLQGLALRDRATFSMIYRSKAVVYGEIGFAWIAFVGYGFNFWTPPFFQREHGVSVAEAGEGLVKAANEHGGEDNITAVLFEIVEGEPDAPQPTSAEHPSQAAEHDGGPPTEAGDPTHADDAASEDLRRHGAGKGGRLPAILLVLAVLVLGLLVIYWGATR